MRHDRRKTKNATYTEQTIRWKKKWWGTHNSVQSEPWKCVALDFEKRRLFFFFFFWDTSSWLRLANRTKTRLSPSSFLKRKTAQTAATSTALPCKLLAREKSKSKAPSQQSSKVKQSKAKAEQEQKQKQKQSSRPSSRAKAAKSECSLLPRCSVKNKRREHDPSIPMPMTMPILIPIRNSNPKVPKIVCVQVEQRTD